MNAAEQRAEQLDVLEKLESMRVALDEAISVQRRMLAETAVTMPPLAEPERPEWLPVKLAARQLGIEPMAARRRAQRGLRSGRARKVGGRLQLHMPSQPEPTDG
ncbi:hypothetical protein GOFOIKOB_1866 [Methylobacterium tardum]|uniref:Uncharacterized protein n=1 Tax=Methylobacterium tardum TaxID=374432 RepID=A0AA37WV30_9HYPH|nr:hypothetical protein [Methylobacterium tardum]URD39293.1 hypothetical protein M6G65_13310 [Methylobacterium tardum]GJE48832.1 hypothetical protein GOFOIKOB_1866 [Methylobacterium tardum]GLS73974.1 hypothetical protein GCM10007890_59890 [Methylobacterium tardum]